MNTNFNKKIAIGTAQFGLNYGVANKKGQLKISEIKKILKYARSVGVDTIDTAQVYGNCEERLGKIGVKNFKLIIKLPVTKPGSNIEKWVNESFNLSLKKLKVKSAYGLLVHNTSYLLNNSVGPKLYKALLKLKEMKKIHKIGASIYSIQELNKIIKKYKMGIILAPLNIFDQRMLKKNYLNSLKNKKIEIYTRSAFLQGLLMMNKKQRPEKFNKWEKLFNKWDNFRAKMKKSASEICLNFIFLNKEIDKTIIGIDNFKHFKQITSNRSLFKMNYKMFNSSKINNLINPSKWNQIQK